ncbi:MAG TPA: hypothetical protein VFD58_31065 [Blastocatellia bacterium]|nr:hypothetical protein [Blastocatellia bacterium]
MKEKRRITIPLQRLKIESLCWQGDELVDWVAGGIRYQLDGAFRDRCVLFGYRFDKAIVTPDGKYTVIYETLGTKGLILKGGRIVREINRSYYCADAYEYPVTLFTLADGRNLIAHCPDEYNIIEIEEVETGRRLTTREGERHDFFHSRLQVSPDSRFLLSAGWIWHPIDAVMTFEVDLALREPKSLDQGSISDLLAKAGEIHNATFASADTLLLSGKPFDDEAGKPFIGKYSLTESRFLVSAEIEEETGTMMPLGEFAVGFYEHPKLIEIATGKIIHRWSDVGSGKQDSSIISHLSKLPSIALDPGNKRFAVAGDDSITVIELE